METNTNAGRVSAPKFTPGPWRVEHTISGKIKVDAAGARICGCAQRGGQGEHDAHLLAASPDLYAALEALEAYTDEYGPKVSPGFSRDYEHARKLYAQARAALAKARGEG